MKSEVVIIMGSKSDAPIMKNAEEFLKKMEVPCEMKVVSAHRTPDKMFDFAKSAKKSGIKVIIAGAGGAAHLPGMVASLTPLPVIGVPILSSNSIAGIDSLLSIVQMPNGIPVATVGINAAQNAGILAIRILAISNEKYAEKLNEFNANLTKSASKKLKEYL